MRPRAGQGEDPERQPGSHADAKGRLALEAAGVDDVAQGGVPTDGRHAGTNCAAVVQMPQVVEDAGQQPDLQPACC